MNAYIYAADIYCEACGEDIRKRLTEEGKAPVNPDDETTYDSDVFPKGPFSDGAGASDSPQHCACGEDCLDPTEIDGEKYGKFLENDLTQEGVKWLMAEEDTPVIKFWRDYYESVGYDLPVPPKKGDVVVLTNEQNFVYVDRVQRSHDDKIHIIDQYGEERIVVRFEDEDTDERSGWREVLPGS